MINENFPKVGDTVYVRDVDHFNASGYQAGVVIEIEKKAGIDKLTLDDRTTDEGYTYWIDLGEGWSFGKTCRRGEESQLLFATRNAVIEKIESELDAVRSITASPYMDQNLLRSYQELPFSLFVSYNPVERLKKLERSLLCLLQSQFGILKLENLYETCGEKTCMDFLNNTIAFLLKKEKQRKNEKMMGYFNQGRLELSPEMVEEFVALAYEEPIYPYSEPLTIRKFLKMCRVAYDASGVTAKFPPDASDLFVYCHERNMTFTEDFRGFENENWDSPEVFDSFRRIRYHPEELQFGGMQIWLRNTLGGWTGNFSVYRHPRGLEYAKQAILAYIALRRNGYPITCIRPEELLKEAGVVL